MRGDQLHSNGPQVGEICACISFVCVDRFSPSLFSAVVDTIRYGSVVATHLLSTPRVASKIGPVIFIDPITFLLHLPDVAYNFVGTLFISFHQTLANVFIISDLPKTKTSERIRTKLLWL